MAQAAIRCAITGLTLVGTPDVGYEPVIVGGADALASDDGDTSYVLFDAEPGVSSGAYLEGTFAPADIPVGHIVTGMFLAVKMRSGPGALGDSQIYVGFWDGSRFATKQDAADENWLWGDYYVSPEDGTTYAYASPDYLTSPEIGFGAINDAPEWSDLQAGESGSEYSFTLGALRAGSIKGYLRTQGFYGSPPGDYLSRVTSFELVVRHAPMPSPYPVSLGPVVYTDYESVPNLADVEDVYGNSSKTNVSETEDRTGLGGGGGGNWNQVGIDAYWDDMIRTQPPNDSFGLASGTANGLYVAFVYTDLVATASPPRVNLQNRMSVWKHLPYPSSLWINNGNFGSTPVYDHQRATMGTTDPLWEFAGLVEQADTTIQWARWVPDELGGGEYFEDYSIKIEKFEVRIHGAQSATGAFYDEYATRLMELEAYDYTEVMNAVTPDEINTVSTDTWGLIDDRANGTIANYEYYTFPTIAGDALGTGAVLDLLVSVEVPADADANSTYVDATAKMELDAHGQPCVFIYFAQEDQHTANIFQGLGSSNVNGTRERSIHGSIAGRYELDLPDRRFQYKGLSPLNGGFVTSNLVGVLRGDRTNFGRGRL